MQELLVPLLLKRSLFRHGGALPHRLPECSANLAYLASWPPRQKVTDVRARIIAEFDCGLGEAITGGFNASPRTNPRRLTFFAAVATWHEIYVVSSCDYERTSSCQREKL